MRYGPRLERIEDKLGRLIREDSERTIFGARWPNAGHEYRRDAPLSAARLSALEGELQTELPGDYRAFLMRCHGAGAGPGYGLKHPTFRARMCQPFPVTRAELDEYLARVDMDGVGLHLPQFDGEGSLTLADHGCASETLLVVRGELAGTMCDLWDHPSERGWSTAPVLCDGRSASFLDWYEQWLDESLLALARN